MFVRLTDLSASVCLFAAFLVQINFNVSGPRNKRPALAVALFECFVQLRINTCI